MATFSTYGQNGKKLSFANWISNISPEDTPFGSATGKESINQTKHTWQVDSLSKASADNAVAEGSDAGDAVMKPTTEVSNVTQILRKVVHVSDSADATANYGRGKELMYQLSKAGAEIKRDLEVSMLTNGPAVAGSAGSQVRKMGGFQALVGMSTGNAVNEAGHTGTEPDPDTGAVVVAKSGTAGTFTEEQLFDLTGQLYLAGAKADTIMVHPKHAKFFSSLQEKDATRVRYFQNNKTIDLEVSTIIDPLGQKFSVVYNRFMPADAVYIFNPSDWTQMVFRAPKREELAKTGSSEKWMIEMETTLLHRNPYASAVLKLEV